MFNPEFELELFEVCKIIRGAIPDKALPTDEDLAVVYAQHLPRIQRVPFAEMEEQPMIVRNFYAQLAHTMGKTIATSDLRELAATGVIQTEVVPKFRECLRHVKQGKLLSFVINFDYALGIRHAMSPVILATTPDHILRANPAYQDIADVVTTYKSLLPDNDPGTRLVEHAQREVAVAASRPGSKYNQLTTRLLVEGSQFAGRLYAASYDFLKNPPDSRN